MKSAEYERGYNAGYKAALLDALKDRDRKERRWEKQRRGELETLRLGGPDSPFKPRGVPGSIYNVD